MSIERQETNTRMSQIVAYGGIVYLAGITARETLGQGVAEQAAEILKKIDDRLKAAGTDKSKALLATVWLQDIRTVDQFNKVWDAWIVPGKAPARACIEARLQSSDKMVEVQLTAAR